MTSGPHPEPIFAALVRTTGKRNSLLIEALQSLSFQSLPTLAIVIVHGNDAAFSTVRQACPNSNFVHVLHASNLDSTRLRGFPLNVGIDYCLEKLSNVPYLFLLDDDDIVYPFFTRVISTAFDTSHADLVYAHTNGREAGQPLSPFFPVRPYHHLLEQNFIASNGYAIRTEALRRTGVKFAEDLDSLEDWFFLVQLLENGVRFHAIDMTLAEFSAASEAEFATRYDLAQWRTNTRRIRRYINSTSFPIPGSDLAQLSEASPPAGSADERFADASLTAALNRRIWALEHSFSWKCTAPLRALAGGILRMRSRAKVRI